MIKIIIITILSLINISLFSQELNTKSTLENIEKIISRVPSSEKTAKIINEIDPKYIEDYINPKAININDISNTERALILGSYYYDAKIASIIKSMKTIVYLNRIRNINENLGIYNIYKEIEIKEIKNNTDLTDSLLQKSFMSTIYFLENNNRNSITILLLTGFWAESLYLDLEFLDIANDKELLTNRISNNKFNCEDIVKLLSPYYNESIIHKELIESIIDLAYIYDTISINDEKIEKLSPEDIDLLKNKVSELRNKIMKL